MDIFFGSADQWGRVNSNIRWTCRASGISDYTGQPYTCGKSAGLYKWPQGKSPDRLRCSCDCHDHPNDEPECGPSLLEQLAMLG